jgi:hypothetical protein
VPLVMAESGIDINPRPGATFHGSRASNTAASDPNYHEFMTIPSAAQRFLAALPATVEYAVERGLATLDQPFIGDLDLVVTKQGFFVLHEIARRQGLIVSVTLSYGGARLFLGFEDGTIRRIDCMWAAGYIGIPICNVRRLLNSRIIDPATKLYVLSERMQAEVVFAVKNAHGGAEKYRKLLEQHGLEVLTGRARLRWLLSLAARQPLSSLIFLCRTMFVYSLRMIFPAGVIVRGAAYTTLRSSALLRYLFQDRIRVASPIAAFPRSRLLAELCLVNSRALVDIDLSTAADPQATEQAVLDFLRKRHTQIPRLLALTA